MQVLDYSAGFPGAKAIRDAGYGGAVRYIGFPDRLKCTNARELADFTAHGIGMALVYEDHADDWRGGYDAGAAAARRARAHADSIGYPKGRPIYMAVDRDVVTEAEFRAAMNYLRGASTILGPEWVGVYGEHDVCARASAEGAARWFWQCRAWSGTPVRLFPGRHLYQNVGTAEVGGVDCDYNDVLVADWGQHTATEGDDVLDADRDYPAFKEMLQRALAYEIRPGGAAPRGDLGPTFFESTAELKGKLDQLLTAIADLKLGGVSKEEIAEIAKDAISDDLKNDEE